ncbi:MAG: M1 family aminopeptidase [Ferruginibacter sp.]
MKTIFLFDIKSYFKRWGFYMILFLILLLGFLGGENARFSIAENIYTNSAYQISFITAFISLTTIFFSTVFASQLLFKELDAHVELLIFSTPLKKYQYTYGRYAALFVLSFVCVLLLTTSFLLGQLSYGDEAKKTSFVFAYYAYPVFVFVFINTFFVTAVLSFVRWFWKNKLLVYVSGLLLYIFYMVTLIYSGSPLMAQSLPQSQQAQFISALSDPFGLSAFFYQTSRWAIEQRNTELISLTNIFLINRLGVLMIAIGFIFFGARRFSFIEKARNKKRRSIFVVEENKINSTYSPVHISHGFVARLNALFSFSKIYLVYILKSIPFVLTAMVLLFAVGMEMYAEIEKGIRIPQKYASTGLMVQTILQNFHGLCMIAVLYYAHELYWKSKNSNFYFIEQSTANSRAGFFAKWFSLAVVICLFSVLMIIEGLVFQILYKYPVIEWHVYAYVFLFAALPLVLLAGLVLLIQKIVHQQYIGLGLTALVASVMTTMLGRKIISYPLLKFLRSLDIDYSDMNGFGAYATANTILLLFGSGIIITLMLVFNLPKKSLLKWPSITALVLLTMMSCYTGTKLMSGYQPKNEETTWNAKAGYEKLYRKYQQLPQPVITDVQTTIDLFPQKNAYNIQGIYVLENNGQQPINKVILNFSDGFTINKAVLINGNEKIFIKDQYQLIELKEDMLPGKKANFEFNISYNWKTVNGHQPLNAIVENGSFMRISRYYPSFGYMPGNEIEEEDIRKNFQLGKATPEKSFDAPKILNNEFINLDMTISTTSKQTAIGVGELVNHWAKNDRNYFQYKTTSPIPFRFAVSSAVYASKKELYKGKQFEIYYHPLHYENVEHLLKNAKLSMDYCEVNFGPYPFKTFRFAEISNFTRGFAATAYPATIFMNEDPIFHANIKADQQQDVINELAGHELSHLWWGNNQISPDDRAGAAMLTETLAMYTEMMLLKKMYGREEMLKRIKMHLGIYLAGRGFTKEPPLYKAGNEDRYISYSKGAVVMYQLSELIGEDKVNHALRNFLEKNKYPNPRPVTMDFINELLLVADVKFHTAIENMFMKVIEPDEKDLK